MIEGKESKNMINSKQNHCEYFIDGIWQSCQIIDFYNVKYVGIVYAIQFKGSLFSVFDNKVRFLDCKNERSIIPLLPNKNMEVIFH